MTDEPNFNKRYLRIETQDKTTPDMEDSELTTPDDRGPDRTITSTYAQLGNRPDISVDDVKYGVRYRGVVNGTTDYGVFITLANRAAENELTGLAHEMSLPPLHTPDEYTIGDVVGVMLVNRTDDRPQLEIVSHINTHSLDEAEFDPRTALSSDRDTLVEYDEQPGAYIDMVADDSAASARELSVFFETLAQMTRRLPQHSTFDIEMNLTERGPSDE